MPAEEVSCYDRVIVQGTLPVFCYTEGMTAYLTKRRIRIFDFTQFVKPGDQRYNLRIEGTRVRHSMGLASIKMNDKFAQILPHGDHYQTRSFF